MVVATSKAENTSSRSRTGAEARSGTSLCCPENVWISLLVAGASSSGDRVMATDIEAVNRDFSVIPPVDDRRWWGARIWR